MSDAINDGGPAFARPISEITGTRNAVSSQRGMSLRAYFAGQALVHPFTQTDGGDRDAYKAAQWAVSIADALIAELNKPAATANTPGDDAIAS